MARTMSAYSIYNFSNFCCVFIIFSSCLLYSNKASEIRRPRGVPISRASLYIPDSDFTCFDNSKTIPFNQVNDDYCDCADGSDEPGTSACPGNFFHCTNAGFKPLYIPSSLVNDGICDCCDGFDEYNGKTSCVNVCSELGHAARVAAQKQAAIAKAGNEARLQLSKAGKQIKQEKAEKLELLKKDLEEAEKIKEEKERLKLDREEVEKEALEKCCQQNKDESEKTAEDDQKAAEQEAFEMFNMLDSNNDNKLQTSELKVRQTFDQNKDGEVSEEEIKFLMEGLEECDWTFFISSVWPKMKPLVMVEKGLFRGPAAGEVEEEEGDGVGTVEDVTNEYQHERQIVDEEEGEEEAEETEGEEEDHEEDEEEEQVAEEGEAKPEDKPQYDEETDKIVKAAGEARAEFTEADRAVRDIQREISQLEDHLQKDYGPEEEFAPLEGECFEYTDREYLYKLCPFDKASQQPKSGGAETRLGQWSRWDGPEEDRYRSMMYDRGQSCWNGPARSTRVSVACGLENAILSVTEPSKCEYHFSIATPSACLIPLDGADERTHDEL